MSIKDHLTYFLQGLLDSLKGIYWLYNLDSVQRRAQQDRTQFTELAKGKKPRLHNKEEPRLLNRVLQCCTLNGFVFGLSIILFKSCLLPLLESLLSLLSNGTTPFWSWLQFLLQWTFDGLWVLPLFLLSRVVNALWFQDIGTLAYRYSVGRPKTTPMSTFIADNLFSLIIQALFLVQALLLSYLLPLLLPQPLPSLIYHTHTSLLYSLYSFEYKWVQMGLPLHQRLVFIEQNWSYFLGFGLPLSLLTGGWGDWVVGGCAFAVSFPVFIISGNEANVCSNTNGPRLKLFSPVVWLSNNLFKNVGNKK